MIHHNAPDRAPGSPQLLAVLSAAENETSTLHAPRLVLGQSEYVPGVDLPNHSRKDEVSQVLSPELKRRTSAEAAALIKKAKSVKELSEILEVPAGLLLYVAYEARDKYYREFEIPKKRGGMRKIHSPHGSMDILQKKLKNILECLYAPPHWVHAFVKTRSILSNAETHSHSKLIINIDLEDFYGCINFGRVRGALIAKPYKFNPAVATVIAQLITFRNKLPQGASTSPLISNIVSWGLDRNLLNLSGKYHLKYTRYADDITFSTSKKKTSSKIISWEGSNPINSNITTGDELDNAIEKSGFKINQSKTRAQIPCIRQEVTGLTVNMTPNIQRKYIRNLRALLNSWKKRGLSEAAKYHFANHNKNKLNNASQDFIENLFKKIIYGHASYLKQIKGSLNGVFINISKMILLLDSNAPEFIQKTKEITMEFDFFICHASEDKNKIALPIYEEMKKQGLKVFIDKFEIGWGDSLTKIINGALSKAKFIIVIISDKSLEKPWPQKELESAMAREINGRTKILPIAACPLPLIFNKYPLLEDKLFYTWGGDAIEVALKSKELLK